MAREQQEKTPRRDAPTAALVTQRYRVPDRRRLLQLAGPIVFAQMAFFGMQTTDTILAGRLGEEVLAAVALGGTLLMIGFTFLMGFALAVAPGVAHRFGAQASAREIAEFASSSLLLCMGLWTVWGLLLVGVTPWLLQWLEVSPALAQQTLAYLQMLVLGTPFLGLFFALRNVLEALGHSRPIMWMGAAALLLNIPLDWALMYGWGPIPAMGAAGCGLATAIIYLLLAVLILHLFWRIASFRPYRPRQRPRLVHIRELWGMGLPIALALASEHTIFAIGGLLMTQFGAVIMGASQIALNFGGMMFMIALGLGQATAVLVGQAAGAGHAEGLRRAGRLGYESCGAIASLISLLMFWQAERIVSWYTQDAAVAEAAVGFLRIAAAFHLVDALQALGAGALRGMKDMRFVMQATTVAYWGFGGGGFVYAFVLRDSPALAVWYVYVAALSAAAIFLGLRFWYQARHYVGHGSLNIGIQQ